MTLLILKNVRFLVLAVALSAPWSFVKAAHSFRGGNYACTSAAYMQLWDSAQSSLVKHQILLDENCWKPMKGMHVDVLDRIGKFARVRYSGNGIVAYAYMSDLQEVRPEKPAVEKPKNVVSRTVGKAVKVTSLTTDHEVMLMMGKPTVMINLLAGNDTTFQLTVTKESIVTGFSKRIEEQQNGAIQVSLAHKKQMRGFGKPDFLTFEVIAVDRSKSYADIRVGGYWHNFDKERNIDLEIKPSTIRISGAAFAELIRPHTSKELEKPFRNYFGKTT